MALTSSLPTLYEYYTAGGINSGLTYNESQFILNGKNFTVHGGSMNYFRVPRAYWRDTLRKMRAAGLNTVDVYVPWNLHEPQIGAYDFGDGGSDMEDFLHLRRFLEMVKEEDLFALVRPGPYICAEWEFGGLPSWLLRFPQLKVRSSEKTFMTFVRRYFNVLLPILAMFQFTRGGPIIGFQVENEYGNYVLVGKKDDKYLKQLRHLLLKNGITEFLYTSDVTIATGTRGTLPDYFLETSNFPTLPKVNFWFLQQLQKQKPLMAMEFWAGWYDKWGEEHQTVEESRFYSDYDNILKYPASANIYMFYGGTNFGFSNGAVVSWSVNDNSGFSPVTTSYDYDAPIEENGDYSPKYYFVKALLQKCSSVKTRLPPIPEMRLRKAYPTIRKMEQLTFNEVLAQIPDKINTESLVPMEVLPINNNSGQSYGYVIYRKENLTLPSHAKITIGGRVCDTVVVLLNGLRISPELRTGRDLNAFGTWRVKNSTLYLENDEPLKSVTLEFIVENWGRPSFFFPFQSKQYKGMWQAPVYINGVPLSNWQIVPLEFKKKWTNSLKAWHEVKYIVPQPALYKFNFYVNDEPQDTYIDMSGWTKGIVTINGFVLGRYARIGPQQCLYLPAPFFHKGRNEIIVFEHFTPARKLKFSNKQIYETR